MWVSRIPSVFWGGRLIVLGAMPRLANTGAVVVSEGATGVTVRDRSR